MKRLEKMVDLIDIVGIEQTNERIHLSREEAPRLELSGDFLNKKIRERMRTFFAHAHKTTALTDSHEITQTEGSSPTIQRNKKALAKMIEKVQNIKSVKVKDDSESLT